MRWTQKTENSRLISLQVAFDDRQKLIGSGFCVGWQIVVIGFKDARRQRRGKQIAHDLRNLQFRVYTKTILEEMGAVHCEQNRRLRNSFSEHTGERARLSVNGRGPTLVFFEV